MSHAQRLNAETTATSRTFYGDPTLRARVKKFLKWRPLPCRLGLHRWRNGGWTGKHAGEYRCERCWKTRKGVRGG